MFEDPDIWTNIKEKCKVVFSDSNEKQMYGTRKKQQEVFYNLTFLL